MKKIMMMIAFAATLFMFFTTSAQAETSPWNLFKGVGNGIAGAVYIVANTPEHTWNGLKENGPIGAVANFTDVTSAGPKLVEEVGHAVFLQETGRDITDQGILNDEINKRPFLRAVRNGIGTGFAVAGVTSWTGMQWLHSTQLGVFTGLGAGGATYADELIYKGH